MSEMIPLKPHSDRPHAGYCYPDCGCPDNDFDWDGFAKDINGTEPHVHGKWDPFGPCALCAECDRGRNND